MNDCYKYGVYYNLDTSKIFYDYQDLRFYFSSDLLKDNFIIKLSSLEIDKAIFEKKYYCKVIDPTFLVIKNYKKVEKRGFRVEKNDKKRINSIVH
ncbi:MAG: hypothetical protein OSJ63_05540, partial [Bacilli bacterium]|nr:hypothetical protein [Bacilli bacterium]